VLTTTIAAAREVFCERGQFRGGAAAATWAMDRAGVDRPDLRPSRGDRGRLFEWFDSIFVDAMKPSDIFLMDEISVA
jgi:hypothetical protein